jgi:hypothetical protein
MKENASLLFGQFLHCCDLYWNPFTLGTHHKPLKFLMESNNFIEKLVRWALIYPHEYDFHIIHRVCKVN